MTAYAVQRGAALASCTAPPDPPPPTDLPGPRGSAAHVLPEWRPAEHIAPGVMFECEPVCAQACMLRRLRRAGMVCCVHLNNTGAKSGTLCGLTGRLGHRYGCCRLPPIAGGVLALAREALSQYSHSLSGRTCEGALLQGVRSWAAGAGVCFPWPQLTEGESASLDDSGRR